MIARLLEENRSLREDLDSLRAEFYAFRGEGGRLAGRRLVRESELPALTGASLADLRRLRASGAIRGYGGTQPKKKRFLFDPAEVAAALRAEKKPAAGRLDLDVGELFARHSIPRDRALSGVN